MSTRDLLLTVLVLIAIAFSQAVLLNEQRPPQPPTPSRATAQLP